MLAVATILQSIDHFPPTLIFQNPPPFFLIFKFPKECGRIGCRWVFKRVSIESDSIAFAF